MLRIPLAEGETVLAVSKRKPTYVFGLTVLCALWFLLFVWGNLGLVQNMFFGRLSFNSDLDFRIAATMWAALFPLFTLLPVAFFLNTIIVTDRAVIIRKTRGQLYVLPLEELVNVQVTQSDTRRYLLSYHFTFFFSDGRIFRHHTQIITKKSGETFQEILTSRVNRKSRGKRPEKEMELTGKDDFRTRPGSRGLTVLIGFPFAVSALLFGLYFSGINRLTPPESVTVTGTVTERRVLHSHGRSRSTAWHLQVTAQDGAVYNILVSSSVYNQYAVSEPVSIDGERGCLGIVYDIRYH